LKAVLALWRLKFFLLEKYQDAMTLHLLILLLLRLLNPYLLQLIHFFLMRNLQRN
jgi:hypothetical protein